MKNQLIWGLCWGLILLTGSLNVWHLPNEPLMIDLTGFKITGPTFSPDSRYLTFRRGGTVGLIELTTGQPRFLR